MIIQNGILHLVILDEAQYIKNAKTKATKIVCELKADHRLCLTGTPIENHLNELWSQFNFLMPGFLGSTKEFRRNFRDPIERFQSGKVPLSLISFKAGGTGLNLTSADTVIHYDPWWNPAVEDQATDRAYRIGQDKPVFVYKLITAGTVEEKIIEMQNNKRILAEGIFESNANSKKRLSADDINNLFEPLT